MDLCNFVNTLHLWDGNIPPCAVKIIITRNKRRWKRNRAIDVYLGQIRYHVLCQFHEIRHAEVYVVHSDTTRWGLCRPFRYYALRFTSSIQIPDAMVHVVLSDTRHWSLSSIQILDTVVHVVLSDTTRWGLCRPFRYKTLRFMSSLQILHAEIYVVPSDARRWSSCRPFQYYSRRFMSVRSYSEVHVIPSDTRRWSSCLP